MIELLHYKNDSWRVSGQNALMINLFLALYLGNVGHATDRHRAPPLTTLMPMSRAAWTIEDSERLKRLVAEGASPARASVIFKRSVGAVQNHARKLGTPFPPRHDIRREILAKCEAAEKSLRE